MPAAPVAKPTSLRSDVSASAAWRLIGWTLILTGVARLVVSIDHAAYRNDFAHYFLSANILLNGENPYVTPLKPLCRQRGLEYDARIPTGGNPPLLTCAVASVAWLPLPAAYGAWLLLQAVSLSVLLVVMRHLLSLQERDGHWLVLIGVVLNTTSLQRQFHYSQVQIMVAACLTAALWFHIQNRRTASCSLAALAAAFKLYPAAILPWFLLADLKDRRDLIRRSLAVAGVGTIVLCITGIDAWRSFLTDGLSVINRSVGGSLTNYSLPAMVNVLAGAAWGWALPEETAPFVQGLGKLLAIGALGGAYYVVYRRRLEPMAAFGLLMAATLAASLVCWSHYFVLMILPVAWLWRRAIILGNFHANRLALVAGSLCLWPELDWGIPVTNELPRLALHFYPLAALGIVALLLARCAPVVEAPSQAAR